MKLAAASRRGKEAVIDILGDGEIAGDDCFNVDATIFSYTATALTDTVAWRIRRGAVDSLLHTNDPVSSIFIRYLGRRLAKTQEELVSRLLNSGERRLARVLVALAEYRRKQASQAVPEISQQILAEMIGSTRQSVNALVGKLRKAGFFQNAAGAPFNGFLLDDDVAGIVSDTPKSDTALKMTSRVKNRTA